MAYSHQGALPVSVVIPAYNRAAMTARAARSALAQRPQPPAEVIVIDDRSSDDTASVAAAVGATVIRRDENGGAAAARNTGLATATSPWVAFLDSDDEWMPGHLATMWPHTPDYGLISTSAWAQPSHHGRGRKWGVPVTQRVTSPASIVAPANPITPSTTMVRGDLICGVGAFRREAVPCEDLDAWIRVLEVAPGLLLPAVTVIYELHPGQVSMDAMAMRRTHRAVSLAYADRSWFTPALRQEMEAAMSFDDLREALRSGQFGRVPNDAWRALGGYRRVMGVRRLRRYRAQNARTTRALLASNPEGRLSASSS